MSDDDEILSHQTNGAYLAMDDAFCARMRKAIATGRESAPVVSSPRLEPKAQNTFPAEPRLPASPSGNTDFWLMFLS
jgi:hypothetical protein